MGSVTTTEVSNSHPFSTHPGDGNQIPSQTKTIVSRNEHVTLPPYPSDYGDPGSRTKKCTCPPSSSLPTTVKIESMVGW